MSYHDAVRDYALSLEGAREEHPFGPGSTYKTAKGKIFAMAAPDDEEPCTVTVKLGPGEGEEALLLPFVSVARYVGRYGWVTATLSSDEDWELTRDWIARSFELVSPKARKPRARE